MNLNDILSTPYFGIILSLMAFEIGTFLYKKTKIPIFNPLLIAITIVIVILKISGISYETYNTGANYVSFFLWPATVALAVPLYKQIDLLKKNVLPVMSGIIAGCITAVISTMFFSKLVGFDLALTMSLVPKSVTTPIGVELSRQLSGIPSITVAAIVFTGIAGAVLGPKFCCILKLEDKLAIGLAMGTAAHAIGTTKALEIGELEGAMSGLSIGVAGLVTVFLMPLVKLLSVFL